MTTLVDRLRVALGPDGVLRPHEFATRATSYWDARPMRALALVRPANTAEVSATLAACHAAGQPVVILGGLTGPVSGADARPDVVALSLERMQDLEEIDAVGATCRVQAGVVLQAVHDALSSTELVFPLDLGARGSCTIGGNVATNAGGLNVFRYGMMRNLVLGIEAVLADGTVLSSLNAMQKNNAGYDLKQLFIGTEGTLGVVTRAVLRLYPRPRSRQTALIATRTFADAAALLLHLQRDLGGTLSAFEAMWHSFVAEQVASGRHRSPFAEPHGMYVVVEAEGPDAHDDEQRFAATLERALADGLIEDALVAQSERERLALWSLREDIDAILLVHATEAFGYDVSLPLPAMPGYVANLERAVRARWTNGRVLVMGHIADGNLHVFVQPGSDGAPQADSDALVYEPLRALGGSVSAEHGIGLAKKRWLPCSRSPAEIDLMRRLKRFLDPQGILNPGCVVDQ